MNLRPFLQSLYPEGSRQGQCFDFLHLLIDFPHIGTLIGAKKAALRQFGILIQNLDTFKIGDVLLIDYPIWGHGALINDIIGSQLQLTESNFNFDLKVHHTRQISAHDSKILGVFRGNWLFAPTPPQFPIQITLDILMNTQPFWNSLLQHMANLQNWFYTASLGRIELIIDYKNTDFKDWPVKVTGNGFDGVMYSIIDQVWMDANIKNFSQANIKILNMPHKDWTGTVFDHPELIELGYAYESERCFPAMAMTVSDEHDDFPIYYSDIGAYAKVCMHEIMHLLYGICGKTNPPESDLTHQHLYGLNGFPVKPSDCFADFDFAKLALLVKN